MSGAFRARRPASPPPGWPRSAPSQRFPHARQDHLDADERRVAASKGIRPGRPNHSPGGLNMTPAEWKLLLLVVLIAAGVRLFRLSKPNSVVFDEVHFGKFASKYIKTQYFVDVHPPLAKLLITLAAFVFGYDGNFDFADIGNVYEHVPYVAMRMVPAILGIATVPLAYLTLRALDCRATTALLASLFITFENGMITQSRHILLDSPLIFFTALTIFFWTGFCNEDKHKPFTDTWWAWLVLAGLSLGAVVSCKWVGLFTIATIGVSTIWQLWVLLGDMRIPPRLWMKHFLARVLCLIIIPVLFYMAMFEIHFLILNGSGDGDGFMSSEFQNTLGGRGMADTFADVAIGSEVTIRHVNTQGGYLHSHAHNYPGGSKQQQITLYPHRDPNNLWRILNATAGADHELDWQIQPPEYVIPFMRIKLRHIQTDKALHSHDIRPPISDVDFQNEVSAYGMTGFAGDTNDDWFVEIEKGHKSDKESGKRLRTLRTHFRLKHALTGCYLFSHNVKLPDWGWEQQEVTCNKNAVRANSLWFIETSTHSLFPADAPKVNYKLPGFLAKFLELQQVMWTTNAGLTERHTYDSRPDAWPRLRRGINFWLMDHRQIYLIGNPLVWFLSSAAVFAYIAIRGCLVLRAKRGYRDFDNTKVMKYDSICGFLFIGWSLHYLPFYIMSRQLFLHHYLPALYFAILLCCCAFDLMTSTLRPRVRLQIAAVLAIIAIWNFQHFSPLAYGSPWTKKKCNDAKWMKTWDFSCNDFLDDYSQYAGVVAATPKKSDVPVATIGGEPGGRPHVVVDEQIPEVPVVDEAQTTTIAFGKAEPGRDIFAGEPVKEIKSDSTTTLGALAEEKEISSVFSQSSMVDGAEKKGEEPASSPGSSTPERVASPPQEDEIRIQTHPATVPDEQAAQKQPQGPLDELAAEANRAAQELYPDAHGEK